ncbi:FAD-binding protein [Herbiconiux sp. L3-i23]|uniref:FAD-binding protein n=1 Tax=Herbiconiux sp. L3-i23 TaxID=2905871 RepID=UPI00204F3D7D|nr:FAD-binding protein [Herbiconiux sp. L3-i23]BDI23112.1 xylitol oxidase [Herbiconiux sp. L3-i23]
MTPRNWAGNYEFAARRWAHPASVGELQEIVSAGGPVRAVGTRHSFNDIADSPGTLVVLDRMDGGVEIDEVEGIAWVSGGMRYGDLGALLQDAGLALHNLASLPHISVAGSIATGTHGSGARNGSLATAVAALELVTADGELRTLQRGDPDFDGAVVGLGALGIVTRVALEVRPTFELEQNVLLDLPFEEVADSLGAILGQGYSTSLFTRWQTPTIDQLWVKAPAGEGVTVPAGGTPAPGKMHPIVGVDPQHTTDQGGVPGAWLDRLPHFKMGFTPSAGDELQSEFFVGADRAADALAVVASLADRIASVLLVNEIRAIAEDELWLSGAYGRDTVAFHFTWQQRPDEVRDVLTVLERELAPFEARPHWGKVFTARREQIAPLYPRFDDFLSLRARLDPDDVFVGQYTRRILLED